MKRNVSGQTVGCQLVSATDGSAFTGSVTVYITGDAGTQSVGSVGGGACTHEGNGFHTYAPAQGETDYAHVAFTFVGTGAVPATVQIYPSFPQTGDSYSLVVLVKELTDKLATMLGEPFGSPGVFEFTADALVNAPVTPALVIGDIVNAVWEEATSGHEVPGSFAQAVMDMLEDTGTTLPATLATVASYIDTEVSDVKAVTDKVNTMLQIASGSPGDYELTEDSLRNVRPHVAVVTSLVAPTAAQVADAVLDELLADHTGGGSLGEAISQVLADTGATAQTAGKLETTMEAGGPGSPGDYRFTNDALAKAEDVVWNAQRDGHATGGSTGAALRNADLRGERSVIRGTVSGTAPTTTTFTPSSLDVAGVSLNQLQGRVIVFDVDTATAALRGQATDITGSSADALPLLTFSALTDAPSAGDTFQIV